MKVTGGLLKFGILFSTAAFLSSCGSEQLLDTSEENQKNVAEVLRAKDSGGISLQLSPSAWPENGGHLLIEVVDAKGQMQSSKVPFASTHVSFAKLAAGKGKLKAQWTNAKGESVQEGESGFEVVAGRNSTVELKLKPSDSGDLTVVISAPDVVSPLGESLLNLKEAAGQRVVMNHSSLLPCGLTSIEVLFRPINSRVPTQVKVTECVSTRFVADDVKEPGIAAEMIRAEPETKALPATQPVFKPALPHHELKRITRTYLVSALNSEKELLKHLNSIVAVRKKELTEICPAIAHDSFYTVTLDKKTFQSDQHCNGEKVVFKLDSFLNAKKKILHFVNSLPAQADWK
jgi:hypothetical protein